MPKCYCVITCQGAALDETSKNWTLFNCIEEVQTPFFNVPHPFETVTFWLLEQDPIGTRIQFRLILETEAGDRAAESETMTFEMAAPRHRMRVIGMMIPASPGNYVLRVEWRKSETHSWHKETSEWRIEFKQLVLPTTKPPQ